MKIWYPLHEFNVDKFSTLEEYEREPSGTCFPTQIPRNQGRTGLITLDQD